MAPVRSLSQSFAILRALGLGRAMTLSEVAEACGISPSSCLALLRTLLGEGVLEQVAGKRYVLSAPWAQAVAAKHGFTRPQHVVDVFGLCPKCSAP